MDLLNQQQAPLKTIEIVVDEQSHIAYRKKNNCLDCNAKPCTYICPSQVFSWQQDSIRIDYGRCVECGACGIVCKSIKLRYPRGGYGVNWRY